MIIFNGMYVTVKVMGWDMKLRGRSVENSIDSLGVLSFLCAVSISAEVAEQVWLHS